MKTIRIVSFAVVAAMMGLLCGGVRAADKKELQQRFEQRYPQILEYKSAGKAGETAAGLLEAVDPSDRDDTKLARLINEENTDRRELYRIVAAEENTTPEKVADRMAKRNFEKARPGEYLKSADGKWSRKGG